MNKTILITGASSGIGKAAAILFQQKGWNVIATMRTPEKETELVQLENTLVTSLDVLDLDSIQNAIDLGIQRFGKIDALVNNAGYGAYGPLETFPRENIIRQFNTNVIGLLDVTRAVTPHFRQNKNGVMINISSIGGQMTFPLGSLYHGTKFAVEGISEALSFEMAQIGVKVKIVEPGMIATDFGGRSFDFQAGEIAEYQPIIGALMKVWRSGDMKPSPASLVADVIYQAATDESTTLRYRAGDDANSLLDTRKNMKEDDFINMIKEQYGL
ncbi:MAG: NAD(P)-dependent dehydrogenase (short-subunit alcohol dehydrogenase family) [Cognaticolwellia sp.]|jgi:NAD(P)-dependent dehydrogenase (short-subunit alcohol dehydrogenase family)